MDDRRSRWFNRTFESASRRLASAAPPPPPVGHGAADANSADWLAGRAEGLTEAFVLAHLYERRPDNASAGVVRRALEFRMAEAWDEAEAAKQSPLVEPDPLRRSGSTSGDHARLGARADTPSPVGPSPLDVGGVVRDLFGVKQPEPQSLRVGPPKLRVVDGGDAA